MDRGASRTRGHARLAQHAHGLTLLQRPLERSQLGVYVGKCVELGLHHLVVSLAEAVQVEHQPAEVPVSQLPRNSEEARPSSHPAAIEEARLGVLRLRACRLIRARRREILGIGLSAGIWIRPRNRGVCLIASLRETGALVALLRVRG
jgi:hypothetical protein